MNGQFFSSNTLLNSKKIHFFLSAVVIKALEYKGEYKKMAISKVDQGKKIDLNVLQLINDFGFIRPIELGKFLWPESRFSHKNASNQLKKLLKKGLVIERKLPESAGFCYVLNKKGANFLKNHDIFAENGAFWGDVENGQWVAPKKWQHALMATGILAHYKMLGYEVFSERMIRKNYKQLDKYPDAMIGDKNSNLGYFVEVERARKTGQKMDKLVEYMMKQKRGVFFGFNVIETLLAFNYAQLDDSGEQLDHDLRFKNAVARIAPNGQEFRFLILSLQMRGSGVEKIHPNYTKTHGSASAAQKNALLREKKKAEKGAEWVLDENDSLRGHYLGFDLEIEEDQGMFIWRVKQITGQFGGDRKVETLARGVSDTLEIAKKEVTEEAVLIMKKTA